MRTPRPASRRRLRSSSRRAKSLAAPERGDRDRQDFRFVAGDPRQDKSDQAAADGGAVGDDVAVEQQALELAVAPSALERGARAARNGARHRAAAPRESTGSPRANRRATKPIIGAAGGRRLAAGRRAPADRAASAGRARSAAAAPSRAIQPISGAPRCSTSSGGFAAGPGRGDQIGGRADDARRRRSWPRARPRAAAQCAAAPACVRRCRTLADRRGRGGRRSRPPRGVVSSAAICGAAKPASVESPIAGFPAASAMPRAAAMPTRSPVKLPGPVVTAMRSSSANSMPASSITRAISGITASAWPRGIGERLAGDDAAAFGVEHGGRAGAERGIDGKDAHDRQDQQIERRYQRIGTPSLFASDSLMRHSTPVSYIGRTSTTSGR